MIVKIKTFSGETLYLPEEDYLEEVMYSAEMIPEEKVSRDATSNKKYKRNNTVGYGTLGAIGGLIAGNTIAKNTNTVKDIREAVKRERKIVQRDTANGSVDALNHAAQRTKYIKNLEKRKGKIIKRGNLIGTAVGAGVLGTLGYLRGKQKQKREKQKEL